MQAAVVTSVLSRLGYNRHMPRSVGFAPKSIGGIGILDLPTEQGAAQLKLLFTHLRSKSYIYNAIVILLESYQITAGTLKSPFLDTSHRLYVDSPWIQSIQQFLRKIKGTIEIPELKQISLIRQHDRAIMPSTTTDFSKLELECINACRIFPQVNVFSEICTDTGTRILLEAETGSLDSEGKTLLWKISKSTIRWPLQQYPPRSSWIVWKKFIATHTDQYRKLNHPLGGWNSNCHHQRKWFITYIENKIHHTGTVPTTIFVEVPSRSRHSRTWKVLDHHTITEDRVFTPITLIQFHQDELTIAQFPKQISSHPKRRSSKCTQVPVKVEEYSQIDDTPITVSYACFPGNTSTTMTATITQNSLPVLTTKATVGNDESSNNLTYQAYGVVIPLLIVKHKIGDKLGDQTIIVLCNQKYIRKHLLKATTKHKTPSMCYTNDWDLFDIASTVLTKCKKFTVSLPTKLHQHNIGTKTPIQKDTVIIQWKAIHLRINNNRVASDYPTALREASAKTKSTVTIETSLDGVTTQYETFNGNHIAQHS
jgi:hypothetical protein